jgi:hypothetical protein
MRAAMVVSLLAGAVAFASWGAGDKTSSGGSAIVENPAKLGHKLRTQELLAAFEAHWPERGFQEAKERARTAARILLDLPEHEPVELEPVELDDTSNLEPDGTIPQPPLFFRAGPEVDIVYYQEFDDLRVTNSVLQDDVTGDADVPDKDEYVAHRARRAFEECFDRLAKAGLIDGKHFDLNKTRVSHTQFAAAPQGMDGHVLTTEFVFSLLRKINGIDFANAGLKVAVHRTGRIAFIRLGGATVASTMEHGPFEVPTGSGFLFPRKVSARSVRERFAHDFPEAQVHYDVIKYILPDDQRRAIIEPRHVFAFSRVSNVDGLDVITRREFVGYSLREPGTPPKDFSEPPKPEAQGDPDKGLVE